jgi:hypothetical protein
MNDAPPIQLPRGTNRFASSLDSPRAAVLVAVLLRIIVLAASLRFADYHRHDYHSQGFEAVVLTFSAGLYCVLWALLAAWAGMIALLRKDWLHWSPLSCAVLSISPALLRHAQFAAIPHPIDPILTVLAVVGASWVGVGEAQAAAARKRSNRRGKPVRFEGLAFASYSPRIALPLLDGHSF